MNNNESNPEDVDLLFKSISDRVTYAVETPDSTDLMALISGYALKTVFNLSRINTIEDAEAMENALADVFYQNLMAQLLEENKSLNESDNQH